ncbi:MAG TPA: T9SS type A sorting domain-containing protein [Flavipsychrobacter sp.]|nr:T9SS type A sorting domain-containing protein [Flavipsychrobacter sp.]
MKKILKSTLLCTAIFTSSIAYSQAVSQEYLPYNNPPSVEAYNRKLPLAWAGGFNNPQLCMADLNGDGIKDLAIYDKIGRYGSVKTFLNESSIPGNPKYVYRPEYQTNFPDMFDYLKLEDFNRDGIADLFHKGMGGVSVYKGYYKGSGANKALAFTFFKELRYFMKGSGMVNCYVAPIDIPAIVDVDNDQDLDIVTYDINGTRLSFYRNCEKEDGLPSDSMRMCYMDECWGKSLQNYERTIRLGVGCFQTGVTCLKTSGDAKTTHAGNTVCLLDYDGDGDFDMLNGNISFSDIQYLKNGKKEYSHPRDSFVSQDTMWGSKNGKTLFMPFMPTAFWLDIDNDGNKDLAFTPRMDGTENYKCIVYYKNKGTNATPDFSYVTDTLLMGDMIDIGEGSQPLVYDYNKDGKPDIFITSDGYYQTSSSSLRARIHYYENTSTGTTTSYKLMDTDFMGYWSKNTTGAKMAFGDIDGDGLDDLLMGKNDGTISYYRNTATSANVKPVYNLELILNDQYGTLDVGDYAAPFIYDINGDGKNDIVCGAQMGKLYYFKNNGGTPIPSFFRVTDSLGGIGIQEDGITYTYTSPYIGKIDNTGKLYLLIGTYGGTVYRYEGIGGGNITSYKRLDSIYCYINVRERATPFVADIDGDSRYEMLVGSKAGGVVLFKQYFNVGINNVNSGKGQITLYPNPASNSVTVTWDKGFAANGLNVALVSVTGQVIIQKDVVAGSENIELDVNALAQGVYYCIVRDSNGGQSVSPVSIVK